MIRGESGHDPWTGLSPVEPLRIFLLRRPVPGQGARIIPVTRHDPRARHQPSVDCHELVLVLAFHDRGDQEGLKKIFASFLIVVAVELTLYYFPDRILCASLSGFAGSALDPRLRSFRPDSNHGPFFIA